MLKTANENISYHVLGFTDKLSEYIVASDVVIGKGSSNTVFEVQYLNRTMIMNEAINRLEEHFVSYAKKNNIAIKEFNSKKVAKIVEKAYNENSDFNLAPFDNSLPNGAEVGADILFDLLKKKFPTI